MSEGAKHVEAGGSEDIGFQEEEEDGKSTGEQKRGEAGAGRDCDPPATPGRPKGAFRQQPRDLCSGVSAMQEEEEESEATSVSSADSRPPTPSANGYPGPQGKEPKQVPAGEQVEDGGEAGHDRLSSSQAPSPEWHECPECGRGFGTSRALKVHRSYHVGRKRPHSGSSATKPPAPPLILPGNPDSQEGRTALTSGRGRAFHYICAECGVGFTSPATLEGHRCEHSWRRSPPAPPRNKFPASPTPREANGDQDTDGADGPYHCTECPGEFGLVSELHEHYMLHARGEL